VYNVAVLASRRSARPRRSSSSVHSQSSITLNPKTDKMKQKYNKAKDKFKFKGYLRPRSRQSALTTPSRSPRSSQEPAATHDQEIPTTSSATVPTNRTEIVPETSTMSSLDVAVPALTATAPEPSPQPEHTPISAAAYIQQPLKPPTPFIAESFCDVLLTVVHGAPDAFPPLKSALGEILKTWKQCEVLHQLL